MYVRMYSTYMAATYQMVKRRTLDIMVPLPVSEGPFRPQIVGPFHNRGSLSRQPVFGHSSFKRTLRLQVVLPLDNRRPLAWLPHFFLAACEMEQKAQLEKVTLAASQLLQCLPSAAPFPCFGVQYMYRSHFPIWKNSH
jgi:hypothetical protein